MFIDTRDKNHSKNFNQIGSYDYVHLHCTGIDGKVVECYMRHKTESITMDIFCQIFLEWFELVWGIQANTRKTWLIYFRLLKPIKPYKTINYQKVYQNYGIWGEILTAFPFDFYRWFLIENCNKNNLLPWKYALTLSALPIFVFYCFMTYTVFSSMHKLCAR